MGDINGQVRALLENLMVAHQDQAAGTEEAEEEERPFAERAWPVLRRAVREAVCAQEARATATAAAAVRRRRPPPPPPPPPSRLYLRTPDQPPCAATSLREFAPAASVPPSCDLRVGGGGYHTSWQRLDRRPAGAHRSRPGKCLDRCFF